MQRVFVESEVMRAMREAELVVPYIRKKQRIRLELSCIRYHANVNFHKRTDVKPAALLDVVVVGVTTRVIQNVRCLNIEAVFGKREVGPLVVVVVVLEKDLKTLEVAETTGAAAGVREEEPIPLMAN